MHKANFTSSSHPRYPWVVTWYEVGKRRQKYFKVKDKAKNFTSIKNSDLDKTAPNEAAVTEAERRVVMLARQRGVPLAEAVVEWEKHHAKAKGVTFGDLIENRLAAAAKDTLSGTYTANLKCMLKQAKEKIGSMPAAEVTTAVVGEVVGAGNSAAWQRQMRTMLSGVFNEAIRAGVLETNFATLAKVKRDVRTDPISILTPEDAQTALESVRGDPYFIPMAIQLFAGLRRAEAQRLDWAEINLNRGHIEVTAAKAKTKTRRLVTLLPNLRAILRAATNKEGPVWTVSDRREKEIRAAFPVQVPHNAMRHSFVSYHLANFGDVSKTELEAGHDRKVLFGHYRELVTKADARKFFAIT